MCPAAHSLSVHLFNPSLGPRMGPRLTPGEREQRGGGRFYPQEERASHWALPAPLRRGAAWISLARELGVHPLCSLCLSWEHISVHWLLIHPSSGSPEMSWTPALPS